MKLNNEPEYNKRHSGEIGIRLWYAAKPNNYRFESYLCYNLIKQSKLFIMKLLNDDFSEKAALVPLYALAILVLILLLTLDN